MELSSSTVKGIEAASSSSLSDESYAALVTAVYQCALGLVDQFAVEGVRMLIFFIFAFAYLCTAFCAFVFYVFFVLL